MWKNVARSAYVCSLKKLHAEKVLVVKSRAKATEYNLPEWYQLHGLSSCPEQQAICFYFVHLQSLTPGIITYDLPGLYNMADTTSILSKVTAAVALSFIALSFIALNHDYSHYRPLAISKYNECLRLVGKAFGDPVMIQSDEFLMAVLLLGVWEVNCASPLL